MYSMTGRMAGSASGAGMPRLLAPLTENGVLRIVGHARYPNSPGTPAAVAELVSGLRTWAGISSGRMTSLFRMTSEVMAERLLDSGQVTDAYLCALAAARRGQLATFDHRLVTDAVIDGQKSLHLT